MPDPPHLGRAARGLRRLTRSPDDDAALGPRRRRRRTCQLAPRVGNPENAQENTVIHLTIEDEIAHVVLNAPQKMNSLDESALHELTDAYTEAEAAGVRALLLLSLIHI